MSWLKRRGTWDIDVSRRCQRSWFGRGRRSTSVGPKVADPWSVGRERLHVVTRRCPTPMSSRRMGVDENSDMSSPPSRPVECGRRSRRSVRPEPRSDGVLSRRSSRAPAWARRGIRRGLRRGPVALPGVGPASAAAGRRVGARRRPDVGRAVGSVPRRRRRGPRRRRGHGPRRPRPAVDDADRGPLHDRLDCGVHVGRRLPPPPDHFEDMNSSASPR